MMKKIIGIDLGTNSIGWAIREVNNHLENQIISKGVLTFEKGVASEKGNEFPKVQKRTESRGKRRNYQAEKYRKFELLKFLIEKQMCPLTHQELDEWRKYTKGKPRKYPQSKDFIHWLRFDFDGDGKPDFHLFNKSKHESYYIFRTLAASESNEDKEVFSSNPHVLGRVLYQLVQRRGFKGRDEEEAKTILMGSNKASTAGRNEIEQYITAHKTLGAALYHYQKEKGGRIRQRYNLRKDYEAELREICRVQGLNENEYKRLQKAIIWQRPLRTQKGLVGLCTFEKSKRRVALSHPLYQEYKTWVFINNLKIMPPRGEDLAAYLHEKIYPLFIRKSDFTISNIIKKIEGHGATMGSRYDSKKQRETKVVALSNFYDFEQIFGEDWKNAYQFESNLHYRQAVSQKKQGTGYTIEDIWHVLHTADDKDFLIDFGKKKLNLDEDKAKKFSEIKLPVGYATLSLSAVKRILPYLRKGIKYSHAVYLANLPKVLGSNEISEELVIDFIDEVKETQKNIGHRKTLTNTINGLIKAHLEEDHRYFIEDNRDLDESEKETITEKLLANFGNKTWTSFSPEQRNEYQNEAEQHFKTFLKKHITDKEDIFLPQIRLHQEIFNTLQEKYNLPKENIKHLWHPSEQDTYSNAAEYSLVSEHGQMKAVKHDNLDAYLDNHPGALSECVTLKLLGSPEPISKGFKNPMALKTLHKLKQLMNHLLITGQIGEDTQVVVEIARELNDNNKRAAIRTYQQNREKENDKFRKQIEEINQECSTSFDMNDAVLLTKMRLWDEQGKRCLYTGEIIKCCDVLDGNKYDIEHTIPASISFDSELKNLTLADTTYNRNIKKKRIPTELENYEEDAFINGKSYPAIAPGIKFMKDKIEKLEADLKENIRKTKYITDKSAKNDKIQDRHIIKFKLDYWKAKYHTFTCEEYKAGWRNSQLRDTQIVTKYALPYLKTVFKNVFVQRGETVAKFKHIYSVMLDDKKDRTKHSHHAIDAAILTLIPNAYHREKILEKYHEHEENKKKYRTKPMDWENFSSSYIINIEKEVLANNLKDDRTLTPTYKKVRKRGRVARNDDKTIRWAKGDAIRGQLHSESFYGVVKQPKRDESNKILFDEDGKMILEEGIKIVIRREFVYKKNASSPGFKSLDEIEKVIVDQDLFHQIETQVTGKSFKEALEEGIWMLNKRGEKVNKIRRIRCYASAGRGRLQYDTAIKIHEHDFVSDKSYKETTHSVTEDNIYCLFYEGTSKGKLKREFRIISAYELAQLGIKSVDGLKKESYFAYMELKNSTKIPLKAILKRGIKAIPYEQDTKALKDLPIKELNDRVYKVYKFNLMGTPYLYLQHHIEARPDNEIESPLTKISIEEKPMRYKLKAGAFSFAIEHIDFEIEIDGTIKWLF